MVGCGVIGRIDAAEESAEQIEALLVDARSAIAGRSGSRAWFAFRFGRGEFGIFEGFADPAARHSANNTVLTAPSAELLDGEPQFDNVTVLAHKLDTGLVRKGVLLRLPIKPDHLADAERFLINSYDIVAREPATRAWFALRWDTGDVGVFDVFPDARGRRAHLTGDVPRQLALHALPWLSGLPQLSLVDVIAQHP